MAGGLGLFVSLYLPWRTASCQAHEYFGAPVSCDLLNLFSSRGNFDGIETSVGHVAALFALLLSFLAAASLIRPRLAHRLPLGAAALAAGYFSLAVGLEARSDARQRNFDSIYAYGAYVGLAAGLVVLLAAAVARRDALARLRSGSTPQVASLLFAVLLLVVYLLPWWKQALADVEGAPSATLIGLSDSAAVVGAALTIWLAAGWSKVLPPERAGLAASVALFTLGAAASSRPFADRLYGLWFALGLAALLLVVVLWANRRQLRRTAQLPWRELGAAAAVAIFVGSLFLPWQRWCYEADSEIGPFAGRCLTVNAWTTIGAAAAALFALALLWGVLEPGRTGIARFETAATFALLVVSVAVALKNERGPGFTAERGVGAFVGFGSAVALLVLALARSRPPTPIGRGFHSVCYRPQRASGTWCSSRCLGGTSSPRSRKHSSPISLGRRSSACCSPRVCCASGRSRPQPPRRQWSSRSCRLHFSHLPESTSSLKGKRPGGAAEP